MTNSGPVPFVPWGTARESGEEVKTIHNEKAPTFHETLEAGVKDAGTVQAKLLNLEQTIIHIDNVVLEILRVKTKMGSNVLFYKSVPFLQ